MNHQAFSLKLHIGWCIPSAVQRFNAFFKLFLIMFLAGSRVWADTAQPAATSEPSLYERSLWEAGVVGGGGYLPDYPAAEQNHFKWIAAPYLVYRGRIMRAD